MQGVTIACGVSHGLPPFATTRAPLRTAAGGFEEDLVVQAQAELWHAAELHLHLDRAQDLAPQHRPVGVALRAST